MNLSQRTLQFIDVQVWTGWGEVSPGTCPPPKSYTSTMFQLLLEAGKNLMYSYYEASYCTSTDFFAKIIKDL